MKPLVAVQKAEEHILMAMLLIGSASEDDAIAAAALGPHSHRLMDTKDALYRQRIRLLKLEVRNSGIIKEGE